MTHILAPNKTPSQCSQAIYVSSQKFFASPVLIKAIGKIAPYNKGNLLLLQLFGSNLEGICHALDIDQYRSVTTADVLAISASIASTN